ncbi:alkaline phosphatase PhoX [Methylococcus sp. Mc7]|uniref:alkaline phosphatase PhoX n=1 Tax=Methylococcus sp. Mc7 TaxID=2860258 RepID=UPI001C5332A3|nr:alkaline phosphatase PhoX [Methylococcus sp. Mc7]QXP85615.1 PhoX family protein [Methylococcus sp. Mc7]
MKKTLLALMIGAAVPGLTMAGDFGQLRDDRLSSLSYLYFGFPKPLSTSASGDNPRTPGQKASDLVMVAKGLKAEILTRRVAHAADMFAFWPNDLHPTHLIFAIEGGRQKLTGDGGTADYVAGDKFNPSVQRVSLTDGSVETILRGMTSTDGIRRTPWGTILVTEETTGGGAYEILNPLATTNYTVKNRATGEIVDAAGNSDSDEIAKRPALPAMSWEGFDITPEGVVYGGDELRPGPGDTDGGALYKFVPATPLASSTPLSDLSQSPLISGSVYAYTASCRDRSSASFPQFGQGCEIGEGAWVKVDALTARSEANAKGATGYYRPEDGHFNPAYTGPGVQFCWTNTGNEAAKNYAEVLCLTDEKPLGSGGDKDKTIGGATYTYLADNTQTRGLAVAVANRVLEGDQDFNSFDNLDFQPKTNNMYVVEDHDYGDIFACLQDGEDRDVKSDGCVKMLSVKDRSAEPTGFRFSGDGRSAYLSIQHSDDALCPVGTDCASLDDYRTDDIVRITGFKVPR